MTSGRFSRRCCAASGSARPASAARRDSARKLAKLDRIVGLFARLEVPVDFESLDGEPVDLIFLLLAPEAAGADHLKALARIARLLRDAEAARKLRAARDANAAYALLSAPAASNAA